MNTRQAILLKAAYDLIGQLSDEQLTSLFATYEGAEGDAIRLFLDIEDELGLCDDESPNDYERRAPIDRGVK